MTNPSDSENRLNEPNKINVTFSFRINIAGLVCYKCVDCGSVLDEEHIQLHATGKHLATHITITDVPVTN